MSSFNELVKNCLIYFKPQEMRFCRDSPSFGFAQDHEPKGCNGLCLLVTDTLSVRHVGKPLWLANFFKAIVFKRNMEK